MRGDVSMLRAIRGPVTLITLGALFALNNFTPYRFSETWPALLIVIGVVMVLQTHASTQGHISGYVAYPNYPLMPVQPAAPQPPVSSDSGQVSHG